METPKNTFSVRLDSLARGILLLVVVLLPLLVLPSSWGTLGMTKIALLALGTVTALILWAIARLNEHRVLLPQTKVLWLPFAIIGTYFLSALFASNVFHSLVGYGFERDTVLAMTIFAGTITATVFLMQKAKDFMRLQAAGLIAFLLIGLFQIARILIGGDVVLPSLFSNDPTASLLGSWNDLAVFSGLALLISLSGLALFSAKKGMRTLLYVVTLVALTLLVLVNLIVVWSVLTLLVLALSIYIFSDASYDEEKRKFKPRIPWSRLWPHAGVLVVSLLFLVNGSVIGEKISNSLSYTYVDVRPSWQGTMIVGSGALSENVLFGVGPNAFREAWITYKPTAVNETNFWDSDFSVGVGLIPTAFVTTGFVGGIAWVLFLVAFFLLGIKLFKNRIAQPVYLYLAVSMYIGALYLWILSIVYVPQIVMLGYAMFLTGASIAVARLAGVIRSREVQPKEGRSVAIVFIGGLVATVLIAGSVGFIYAERVSTSIMLARSVQAAEVGDFDRAEYILDRASLLNKDARAYQIAINIGFARLAELLNQEVAEEDIEVVRNLVRQTISDIVAEARAVVSSDTNNYRYWILLADVYAQLAPLQVDGAYESAVDAYTQANQLNPSSPLPFMALAQLAVSQDDTESAKTLASQATALKSNYTDAYYLLSQIAIQENNVAEAINATEAAVLLQPNNTGLLFQLGVLQYSEQSYDKAIPILERAVALDVNYANALYFLGLSYEFTGNTEGALAAFERIAVLNPDNEEIQDVVQALQSGQTAVEALGNTATTVEEGEPLPVSDAQ